MFHKAVDLQFKKGTMLEVTFYDGAVKQYDVAALFEKYPQMQELRNRELFLNGRLAGYYGIIWNDELDLETETIYEEGETVKLGKPFSKAGEAVYAARAKAALTQKELAEKTGIDQSDISKIERGLANPTVETLEKIAAGLDMELAIEIR